MSLDLPPSSAPCAGSMGRVTESYMPAPVTTSGAPDSAARAAMPKTEEPMRRFPAVKRRS